MSTLNSTASNIMLEGLAVGLTKVELCYFPVAPGIDEVIIDTKTPSFGTASAGQMAIDTSIVFTVTVTGASVTANLLRFRKTDDTDLGYKLLTSEAVFPTSGTYTLPATTGLIFSAT